MKLLCRSYLLSSRAIGCFSSTPSFTYPISYHQHPSFSTMSPESHSLLIKNSKLKNQPIFVQRRGLSVHEYQAMMLLQKADIPVPEFHVARSPDEVRQYANELGNQTVFIIIY